MRTGRPLRVAMLGTAGLAGVLIGIAGCDGGTPPSGSRAVVASDHLERQQAKIEQLRAAMKSRPSARPVVRR
jgi:hypothetical protein